MTYCDSSICFIMKMFPETVVRKLSCFSTHAIYVDRLCKPTQEFFQSESRTQIIIYRIVANQKYLNYHPTRTKYLRLLTPSINQYIFSSCHILQTSCLVPRRTVELRGIKLKATLKSPFTIHRNWWV